MFRGRILLHCDSLVGEEGGEGEAGDGPIVHEPPREDCQQLNGNFGRLTHHVFVQILAEVYFLFLIYPGKIKKVLASLFIIYKKQGFKFSVVDCSWLFDAI